MSTIAFSQPETVREPHGRSGSFVSDREIANRVWAIRSSWNIEERMRRRREAERRFERLAEALNVEIQAA